MNAVSPPTTTDRWVARWQRFSAASVRAFHAYAGWLVGISWRRFIVLSLLTLVTVGILHDKPPFTWKVTEQVDEPPRRVIVLPPRPRTAPPPPAGAASQAPAVRIEAPGGSGRGSVEITIGSDGVRVVPRGATAASATSAASAAAAAAASATEEAASAVAQADEALQRARAAADAAASAADREVRIELPAGAVATEVRRAVEEARREVKEALRSAKEDAAQAVRDAEEARRDAEAAIEELSQAQGSPRRTTRTRQVGIGDLLMQLTLLWIAGSAILKFTYKGRLQAEVKAAQATETAEAESLRRQVVEARMAAMQAQVEPHFLFNTLASIDHLIETDPPRASQMQKNLIALLRASMPTMREAGGAGAGGVRDLGREIAVIRPYLEILKVRMEERLTTEIAVPDGLLSAEFPPMMIQTLVENAIKHGLEPKAEGGHLRVAAEIVHGKLQVTVADTGLGFGKAATAGTGVGLANIRERLQLLHGPRAALTVAENTPGGGTVVTVTVPYRTVDAAVA